MHFHVHPQGGAPQPLTACAFATPVGFASPHTSALEIGSAGDWYALLKRNKPSPRRSHVKKKGSIDFECSSSAEVLFTPISGLEEEISHF